MDIAALWLFFQSNSQSSHDVSEYNIFEGISNGCGFIDYAAGETGLEKDYIISIFKKLEARILPAQ
ncbi:MAG: hypothetical protein ABIA04_14775 [Pseudomonadota bacterium]